MSFARRLSALLLAVLMLAAPVAALADDKHEEEGEHERTEDHETARKAQRSGEVRPLREILEMIAREHPGDVLGVEFRREKGRWIYEIRELLPDGRHIEIYVDAATGTVIEVEGT